MPVTLPWGPTTTLGLGIGATAALFAVLHGIVLRPLPYPEPDRLVSVSEDNPGINIPVGFTSLPNYLDWRHESRVFAYTVTERRHEIGIRMALGANRERIRRLILRRALRLGVLGIGCGIAVALGLARLLAGLLFGVSPVDGATYTAAAVALLALAAAASYLPASRASRLDPASTLRGE